MAISNTGSLLPGPQLASATGEEKNGNIEEKN
jgi:hypothetical protein